MNYILSYQKSFSSLAILLLLVPMVYLASLTVAPPQKAQATLPVADVANAGAHFGNWLTDLVTTAKDTITAIAAPIISAQTTLTATATSWYSWIKTLTLDTIAYAIKRALVISITNKMIAFVRTGFNGGPTYVQNPGRYYGNVANSATQAYLYELDRLKAMTDPVSLTDRILDDTQRRLEQNAYTTYQRALTPAPEHVFPGGKTGYDAYMADFDSCQGQDDWECLMDMTDPANDPWAVSLAQQQELKKRQTEALALAQQEIAAANGFATVKTCVKQIVRGNTKQCTDYLTKIPGKIIVDQLQKYQASSLDELHNVHSIQESVLNSLVQACTDWMVNGLGGPSVNSGSESGTITCQASGGTCTSQAACGASALDNYNCSGSAPVCCLSPKLPST